MSDDELMSAIGANVRACRAAAGLSQAELGERMGMAVPHVSRLESGTYMPALRTLNRCAVALGVSICRLVRKAKGANDGE